MSIGVLIVDDSKLESTFLSGLLGKLGITPMVADCCDAGVKLSCERKFDLMFIDYFMPEADGVHTLREIRQQEQSLNRETPALALGSSDTDSDSDFFMDRGFVNYLEKPVDFEMLHAALILYLPEDKRGEVGAGVKPSDAGLAAEGSVLPEWLSGVTGLSVTDGVKNCGTEKDYLGALEIFYRSIDKMSGEIQEYYDNGDLKNYTIKVHALKSSARIIGLSELSEKARLLESAGDSEDTDYISENTDVLLEQYRSYRSELSRLDDESETAEEIEKTPADQEFLEDAFSSLDDFAGQMDYDLVEMVVESLREHSLEPREQALFEEIDAAFLSLDWNGIRTAAQKYFSKV